MAAGPMSIRSDTGFAVPEEAGADLLLTGGAYLGSFGAGINALSLALRSDSGGKPGAVLESFSLINVLTVSGSTVGFNSTASPVLSGGHSYWLTAEMTDPTHSTSYWWTPVQADPGPAAASRNGGPWTVSMSNRGAFQIFAAPIASAAATPLPATLGNAAVTLGGRTAPLTYVGPTQINFQVPYETGLGSSTVIVNAGGLASRPVPVIVADAAPGVFVYGNNWAVIQNADYSLNGPSNPAKVGDYLTLYGTGGGAVNPALATGAAAPASPLSHTTAAITASINGVPAKVTFAGLTPGDVGLLQVNLQVPDLPTGNYSIQLSIGGTTSNTPTIAITR